MNVLAVGAHPDDVEILCAGTLARYSEAGHQVYVAIATNGELGSETLPKKEITEIRREEAEASCAVIGARLIWMGFPDAWLLDTPEVRTRFIDVIREARPEVMFVHGQNDYHPDHRVAGRVAVDSRIPSTMPLSETEFQPVEKMPHVFVMDNMGGVNFEPEFYVDIGETFELKKKMLKKHKSQEPFLEYLFGMNYVELVEVMAKQRGLAAGCRYAEAFKEVKTFPRTGSGALLPDEKRFG